jgi:hypothetical protein
MAEGVAVGGSPSLHYLTPFSICLLANLDHECDFFWCVGWIAEVGSVLYSCTLSNAKQWVGSWCPVSICRHLPAQQRHHEQQMRRRSTHPTAHPWAHQLSHAWHPPLWHTPVTLHAPPASRMPPHAPTCSSIPPSTGAALSAVLVGGKPRHRSRTPLHPHKCGGSTALLPPPKPDAWATGAAPLPPMLPGASPGPSPVSQSLPLLLPPCVCERVNVACR